ncbi:hypothetical protein [Paraburkholderia sp. J41]|uniref:hypothetical protein n=1 Tax=Paraburkholderia sp. J41 TaxID=2805433 RepID=UPI002AC36849|nr:hypothetical protein [Paraburkholderia sp. J41]
MKIVKFITAVACLFVISFGAECKTASDEFLKYSVDVFKGELKIPDYYKKTADGWRDDEGKLVDIPHVNFSGKYFIGRHSCGTECVYYTLSDLTTGKDYDYLDMFSSGGDTPTLTRDGRRYLTELLSKANSRLLVAKYHISASTNRGEECRQKEFLLNSTGRISPLSTTTTQCIN